MRCRVTDDKMNWWFAHGTHARLDHDLRAHQPCLLAQRSVADMETYPFDTNRCSETCMCETILDTGHA